MKRASLAVCLLLTASAGFSFAQEITGTIAGTVRDASGGGIHTAKVTITNTDQNAVVRTTTTDTEGNYVAALLPIGHCSVTVSRTVSKRR